MVWGLGLGLGLVVGGLGGEESASTKYTFCSWVKTKTWGKELSVLVT